MQTGGGVPGGKSAGGDYDCAVFAGAGCGGDSGGGEGIMNMQNIQRYTFIMDSQ